MMQWEEIGLKMKNDINMIHRHYDSPMISLITPCMVLKKCGWQNFLFVPYRYEHRQEVQYVHSSADSEPFHTDSRLKHMAADACYLLSYSYPKLDECIKNIS